MQNPAPDAQREGNSTLWSARLRPIMAVRKSIVNDCQTILTLPIRTETGRKSGKSGIDLHARKTGLAGASLSRRTSRPGLYEIRFTLV
jgi:hypothetical protein